MKTKQLANMYTKQYVQEVFEKRLREEGFTCPDDKCLCWYRVVNREIVNSIIFWSPWTVVPVELEIGYGIFPLFSTIPFTPSITNPRRPIDGERFSRAWLRESESISQHQKLYSPAIWVYAPGFGGKGIYTFDKVLLPRMNSVSTVREAYQYHIQRRLDDAQKFDPDGKYPNLKYCVLSETFMDMVVYLDDQEMYPYCEWCLLNRGTESLDESEEHREQLEEAILDGKRDEYLQILERRKEKNIRTLQKRFGITV